MKYLLIISLWTLSIVSSNSQVVTFYSSTIEWDDVPLSIQGKIGQRSGYEYLKFVNKTAYTVYVDIHTHSEYDFIKFRYDNGNSGSKIRVTLNPYGSYNLKSYVYKQSGYAKVYNDELGLDISYYSGNYSNDTAYFEIDFTAYLYKNSTSSSSTAFTKPNGYHYIEQNGLPARWSVNDLPLTIYSNHTSFGYSNNYSAVLKKAINMWNTAGKSVGLSVNFFELTNNSRSADIQMDWSGKYVPQGALGIAYPGRNIVGMLPLNYYNGLGGAGETLCQELCHLLGVEHSNTQNDIMNGTAHGHWHNLSEISLTERDRQMLGWLYSLHNYYRFRK